MPIAQSPGNKSAFVSGSCLGRGTSFLSLQEPGVVPAFYSLKPPQLELVVVLVFFRRVGLRVLPPKDAPGAFRARDPVGEPVVDLGVFVSVAPENRFRHFRRPKQRLATGGSFRSAKGVEGRVFSPLGRKHLDPAGTKRIDDAQQRVVGAIGGNHVRGSSRHPVSSAIVARGEAFYRVKEHGGIDFVFLFFVKGRHERHVAQG
mmetsp:Transcript_1729/g.3631  ORF Transcript_1729/g.3631 Transcript_1729/m.3631 type:complete len:203 (-) Transcript_1729:64-672(-)